MQSGFRVAVLISGRGSNLKALLDNAQHYNIIAVLSDNPDAPGLTFAHERRIPCHAFKGAKAIVKEAIFNKCRELDPDLIALAGFMQIIPPAFVDIFYGKIVNIHPSLLPAFPGLDTHRRAIEAGAKQHGCSVHFVDKGVDTGPLIAQASLEILPKDNKESLAARVLALEHCLYPWVVSALARREIRLEKGHVYLSATAVKEAGRQGFLTTP